MMAVYFFNTLQEFNEWHNKVNTFYGLPDGQGTIQYTIPDVRSTGVYAQVLDLIPTQFKREDVGQIPIEEEVA